MTDDPRPLAASLGVSTSEALAQVAKAREVLKAANPSLAVLGDDLDLDPAELERERQTEREAQRRLRWSAVCPQRFYAADMSLLDDAVRAQVEAWAQLAPRPNLVLAGPVGVGKTYAALAAVKNDWLERGLGVEFLPETEALDELRPGGSPGALERLLDVERLVLDDVGSSRPTDWTAERLYLLVNRRWMEERPLIATTNLTLGSEGKLIETLGERTYSRLVGSDAVVVRMTGDDRRRKR